MMRLFDSGETVQTDVSRESFLALSPNWRVLLGHHSLRAASAQFLASSWVVSQVKTVGCGEFWRPGPVDSPVDVPERASQKEFGVIIGCSQPMVHKHKKAGRLVMDGRDVMVRESIALVAALKHPTRGGKRPGKR